MGEKNKQKKVIVAGVHGGGGVTARVDMNKKMGGGNARGGRNTVEGAALCFLSCGVVGASPFITSYHSQYLIVLSGKKGIKDGRGGGKLTSH